MKFSCAVIALAIALVCAGVSLAEEKSGLRKSIFDDEEQIKGGFFQRPDGAQSKAAEPAYDDFEQRRRAERQFEASASSESSQESSENSSESWSRE